ncbi:protease inhibitor I42 family protein [Brevundimonas sp. DC300-4]|uniref:protease inhibitor I42 family protein n=1 Tax=unclassified Brevundimonas TaxID=2622653 RepID=UPI003CF290B1
MTSVPSLMIASVLVLAACNAGPGESSSAAVAATGDVLGVRDGRTTLAVGQTLLIELPSNSTTGYRWQVAETHDDLLLPGAPFGDEVTDPHSAGMVGVGGATSWRFRTGRPGTTTLTFTYSRSWETNAPAETATYRITVR